MEPKTEHYRLDSELTLQDGSESPLAIRAVSLALTKQNDVIIECRITLQVSPELYQRIDTEALFNLKPEVRSPLLAGAFGPSPDIQIVASLDHDLLPRLAEHAADVNQAAAYLQSLSREQPDNPLMSTYSIIGNFELDFADGGICYKTSIDVKGDTLSSALIKQLVYANVTMMDEYLPGIMSVIYGDVLPVDAIAQIELTQPSDEKQQQDDREDTVNPSS